MKRPNDQAKLLFLYLLRSTANAWATDKVLPTAVTAVGTTAATGATATATATASPLKPSGHVMFRLAKRTDIPYINKCNVATLPENYHTSFYQHHLKTWPELAIVAEHVPSPRTFNNNNNKINNNKNTLMMKEEDFNPIIGYVLGKVSSQKKPFTEETKYLKPTYEMLGHVTSLAIMPSFRRQGIAQQLMNQLHYHLKECYRADGVGLHVRITNKGAFTLYANQAYKVDQVIPSYYQDGEDAFYMRKNMQQQQHDEMQLQQQGDKRTTTDAQQQEDLRYGWLPSAFTRKQKPWEIGPQDTRLPRSISLDDAVVTEQPGRKHQHGVLQHHQQQEEEEEEEEEIQVFSGSY